MGKPSKMDKIFISYAKEDSKEAKKIFSFLETNSDFIPWLDEKFLLPGMYWEDEIMQVIDECKLIILVLSVNSVSKTGFVQKEFKLALEKIDYLPSNSIFIIPVKVTECVIKEPRLKKIQYVELFKNWESGMSKVLQTLEFVKKEYIKDKENKTNILQTSVDYKDDYERLTIEEALTILDSSRNFSSKNCMYLDFQNKDLTDCNFRAANLVAANFRNANLRNSNFTCANLERADLTGANIEMTNLWGANLWGAKLTGIINFEKVLSFEHTNLWGTYGIENYGKLLKKKDIILIPEYGEFSLYFMKLLGINSQEYRDLFSWMKHPHFTKMFSRGYFTNKKR